MGVYLEGTLVDTVSTAMREVHTDTYQVTVGDGQLTVLLDDLGGSDPNVVIEALEILSAGPPPAVVSIEASDPNAAEEGLDPGQFLVNRSGDTSSALTVYYTIGGTATAGSDYDALSDRVVIPAGASSAPIDVTPIDDGQSESDETVELSLGTGGGYTIGSPGTALVTIADNDPPLVSISASDAEAAEAGLDPGQFLVTRTGSTDSALTVYYTIGGTATQGSDYQALSGSVEIAAGAASAPIDVTPIDDTELESSETVQLTLGGHASYTVGSPSLATVNIVDDDFPLVSITASDANAAEAGLDPGQFVVTRTGSTASALTVYYTIGGTATQGSDYQTLSGSVEIAAGASSAPIGVTPIDDTEVESSETVALTLDNNASYTVGAPSLASVTIADDDQPAFEARYDFGTSSSPLEPGYERVTGTTGYTAGLGYGWNAGTISHFDRRTGSDLERDFNYTALGTFLVDVPNGTYDVVVTLGDLGNHAHDQMGVYLEGTLVDTVSTAMREVHTDTYQVTVGDGQLTVLLDDLGG
ncbi:MAG: hypothetical protein GY856_35480, partial [bacterium]|nr:hypothetical protein [bacterium]